MKDHDQESKHTHIQEPGSYLDHFTCVRNRAAILKSNSFDVTRKLHYPNFMQSIFLFCRQLPINVELDLKPSTTNLKRPLQRAELVTTSNERVFN